VNNWISDVITKENHILNERFPTKTSGLLLPTTELMEIGTNICLQSDITEGSNL